MTSSPHTSHPGFHAGDRVVLAEGPYQGTSGVFRTLRPDLNWAEIEEPNSKVRTHPVRWLQRLAVAIFAIVLLTPSLHASDLSRYRDFQLGMNLPAVVKAVGVNSPRARVIHERPDLIQQLDWQPERYSATHQHHMQSILLSFSNVDLFLMWIDDFITY